MRYAIVMGFLLASMILFSGCTGDYKASSTYKKIVAEDYIKYSEQMTNDMIDLNATKSRYWSETDPGEKVKIAELYSIKYDIMKAHLDKYYDFVVEYDETLTELKVDTAEAKSTIMKARTIFSGFLSGIEADAARANETISQKSALEESDSAKLMDAIGKNDTALLESLLKNSTGINARDSINQNTALIQAAYSGRTEMVRILIENGADVNARNRYGDTALAWASEYNYTEIAELLKAAGAKE